MNEIVLPTKISKEIEFTVTKEYTAVHLGSGSISVLATPSMILFMEIASGWLAHEHLPQDYTTVGTKVCIEHLAAVMEGQKVVSKSELITQDKRKLVFSVEVIHNDTLIGKGTHERFIVNEKRFLKKLENL